MCIRKKTRHKWKVDRYIISDFEREGKHGRIKALASLVLCPVKSSKAMRKNELDVSAPEPIGGQVVFDYAVSMVEGRLLTFIEAMGLPQSQEKSVKDIVRQELWKVYIDSVYITGYQVQEAIKENSGMSGRKPH